MTLACEDGQLVEAHKVIFAGQDRYHYINTTNINIEDININEFTFHISYPIWSGVGVGGRMWGLGGGGCECAGALCWLV